MEIYATGKNVTQLNVPEDNHAEDDPHRGLLSTNTQNPPKATKQKWTRDEYKEVMEANYDATLNPSETSATDETYNIWRNKKPTKRSYLDANKLANIRRDIIKNKHLANAELEKHKDKRHSDQQINGSK